MPNVAFGQQHWNMLGATMGLLLVLKINFAVRDGTHGGRELGVLPLRFE